MSRKCRHTQKKFKKKRSAGGSKLKEAELVDVKKGQLMIQQLTGILAYIYN